MAQRLVGSRRVRSPRNGALGIRVLEHVRRLIHAIHTQSVVIEEATGLTGPQFWALQEVARARDGLALGELARRLALHKANAGRLAERLAAKRLVVRKTAPDDRRVVVVRVTAAGLRKAELPVSAPPQAHLLALLGGLPATELQSVEAALRRLVGLLGAEGLEAGPIFDALRPTRGVAPPGARSPSASVITPRRPPRAPSRSPRTG